MTPTDPLTDEQLAAIEVRFKHRYSGDAVAAMMLVAEVRRLRAWNRELQAYQSAAEVEASLADECNAAAQHWREQYDKALAAARELRKALTWTFASTRAPTDMPKVECDEIAKLLADTRWLMETNE